MKPIWQHSFIVTLMQLRKPKNVVKVTQLFLECSITQDVWQFTVPLMWLILTFCMHCCLFIMSSL